MPVKNSETRPIICTIKELNIKQAKGLRNLSLDFPETGLTGIMGPNGCGKSTILHLLACSFNPINWRQENYRFPNFFLPVRFPKSTNAFSWEGTEYTLEYDDNTKKQNLRVRKEPRHWMRYERRPKRWVSYLGVKTCVPDIENEKKISRITYAGTINRDERSTRKILEDVQYILNKPYTEFSILERDDRKTNLKVSVDDTSYTSLSMGSGEQRVFKILETIETAPAYGLILIDEIDLLLHEHALKKLIEKLKEKATSKRLQIIFTAHNQSLLSVEGIEFKHIYQTRQGTNCLTGKHPEALHQLTGHLDKPINLFVEDLLSKAIVQQICTEEGIRAYSKVTTYGACDNAFTLAAGLFLSEGNALGLSNKLFILDGDEYQSKDEKLKQIKKRLSGTESGREEEREQVLSHIHQLNLPEGTQKPECFYRELLIQNTDIANAVEGEPQQLLNGIVNLPTESDHHQLFLKPIKNLDMSEETGYSHIALLLSKTPEWAEITRDIRKWIQGHKIVLD